MKWALRILVFGIGFDIGRQVVIREHVHYEDEPTNPACLGQTSIYSDSAQTRFWVENDSTGRVLSDTAATLDLAQRAEVMICGYGVEGTPHE